MKTPMQELLEKVQEYRDAETSPIVVSRLNSVCVDILGMLDKEKEQIKNAYSQGREDANDFVLIHELKYTNKDYYNETYGGNK